MCGPLAAILLQLLSKQATPRFLHITPMSMPAPTWAKLATDMGACVSHVPPGGDAAAAMPQGAQDTPFTERDSRDLFGASLAKLSFARHRRHTQIILPFQNPGISQSFSSGIPFGGQFTSHLGVFGQTGFQISQKNEGAGAWKIHPFQNIGIRHIFQPSTIHPDRSEPSRAPHLGVSWTPDGVRDDRNFDRHGQIYFLICCAHRNSVPCPMI